MVEYAPPVLEVNADGVMEDKSQDADWLRARYFEQTLRIEELEKGVCRFNCRTAKQNWIEGYRFAAIIADPDMRDTGASLDAEAEEQYREWKRRQEKAGG